MFEVITEIAICLIIATIIGWIIGYVMGKSTCEKRYKKKQSILNRMDTTINHYENNTERQATIILEEKSHQKKPPLKGTQPALLLSEPHEGGKDNLQLIKGVGKVLEKVLNETGIYHFSQIANLTKDEVQWLNASIAFPGRIEREKWVQQAEELAKRKSR